MINAVFFDLDETLISRGGAIRSFIADQYARFQHRLSGIDAPAYTETFLTMEDNGRIPKDQLYPVFVQRMNITGVDAETLLEDYRSNYPKYAVLNPGALETVETIRRLGRGTGIVTNGNVQVQNAKIDSIGLRDLLDTVVISEQVGLRKPDPAIFTLATGHLSLPAHEVLFVGDNPEVDIVGAVNAGMQTAWFRNGATWPGGLNPRADVDIDRVDEVLRYPGRQAE